MILYYSGTGNSEYVAKRIGRAVDDTVVDLFERLRNRDCKEMYSERAWVIVTPTYAWRIPRILEAWLKKTKLSREQENLFCHDLRFECGKCGKIFKGSLHEETDAVFWMYDYSNAGKLHCHVPHTVEGRSSEHYSKSREEN